MEFIHFLLILVILSLGFVVFYIFYEKQYYRSDEFQTIKKQSGKRINEFNSMYDYVLELKQRSEKTFQSKTQLNIGTYRDESKYSFSRRNYAFVNHRNNVYNCSLQVCRNAQNKPFDYVCKYFNINADEQTITVFENMLNNYLAMEQAMVILTNQRDEVVESARSNVPLLIKLISDKLEQQLGFYNLKALNICYPQCTFQYISAGGNSSMSYDVTFEPDVIEQFLSYLNEKITNRRTAKYQRSLMTKQLREHIKERDNYSCCYCGNSIYKEPNLLLEIDHIVPVSKGGLTEESNLQTLCWKCNRAKSNKLI